MHDMEHQTETNLQLAFEVESQAYRRYQLFVDKAKEEGYPQIARMFSAAAEAKKVSSSNLFKAINKTGSTKDSLLAGISGEYYAISKMYPHYIEHAVIDNDKGAKTSFEYAEEVGQIHHDCFQQALEALEAGQQPQDEPYFVCQVCGNSVAGEAPDKCALCGSTGRQFRRVE